MNLYLNDEQINKLALKEYTGYYYHDDKRREGFINGYKTAIKQLNN